MKLLRFPSLVIALHLLWPGTASAQPAIGYAAAGIHREAPGLSFPSVSGGAVVDLPHAWVSAGGQADLFTSNGYFAGRGTVFGQLNFTRRRAVRPCALAGVGWGEADGPMIGAGVEAWGGRRIGLRVTIQDYLARVGAFDCGSYGIDRAYCDRHFNGGRAYIRHQTSVLVGVAWR
jgi:hypothetical protein